MKKFLILLLSSFLITSAQAKDFTAFIQRDFSGGANGGGISIGEDAGPVSVNLGFDRLLYKQQYVDTFFFVGSYEYLRINRFSSNFTLGGAYARQQKLSSGFALLIGAGIEYDLSSKVAFQLDVWRQYGEEKIQNLNGNVISTGFRFKF